MTLIALIEDIIDKACKSDKKAEGGGVHYRGKPNKKSKRKSREKSKGKLYKNYKNPNTYYTPEDYFVTNKKLRKEWEKKNGRVFVPYEPSKSKLKSKSKSKSKELDSYDSSGSEDSR